MSITATIAANSISNSLAGQLQAGGVSAKAIGVVQQDLADISTAAAAPGGQSGAALRDALGKKIDEDVASGKLGKQDAAAVKQALGLENAAGTTGSDKARSGAAPTGNAPAKAGHAHGGGGGSGGSSAKTEVSRVETVSQGIKTAVITYSDGTTATQTSVSSAPDTKPRSDAQKAYRHDAASYLSSLDPGSLFSIAA